MPTLCARNSFLSPAHPHYSIAAAVAAAAPNCHAQQQLPILVPSPAAWPSRSLSAGCLSESELMNQYYTNAKADLKLPSTDSKLELSHHKDRLYYTTDSTTSCTSSADAHAAYHMVKKSLSLMNNQDAMADLFSTSSSEMRRKSERTIEGAAPACNGTSDMGSSVNSSCSCCSVDGECCSCSSMSSASSLISSSPPSPSSSSASEDDSTNANNAADDGSVASRLLSAIGKSISSPSLGTCKEIVRETPYQKILRLRRMKLHHCTEELGSESCDYSTISSLSAPSSSSSSSLPSSSVASNGIDQDSAPMSSLASPDQYYGHAKHQYSHYDNARHQSAPPLTHRKATNFPPPLSPTSDSGSSFSLTLRPYRHDGRFVLREEKVPCIQHNHLRASRSGGRLTLFLANPMPSSSDSVTSQSVNTDDVEETLEERVEMPDLNSIRKEDEVLESATTSADDVQPIGTFSALDKDEDAELSDVEQNQLEQLKETPIGPLHIEGELAQEDILLEEEVQEQEKIQQELDTDHAGHDQIEINHHHSTNCTCIHCDYVYENSDQAAQADELQILASHEQVVDMDELWGGVASDSAAKSTLDANISLRNAVSPNGHTDHVVASFSTGKKKHLQPYPTFTSSCNFSTRTGHCRSQHNMMINLSQSYTEKLNSCCDPRWSSILHSTNCSTGPTSNHSNNMCLKTAINYDQASHKPATIHSAIAQVAQPEGARSLPASSFNALDSMELMASQPGINIGNYDWLQSLHCKGLDYRNEISPGFYMKVHCVATRS